VKGIKNISALKKPKRKDLKEERKELIRQTKDKILNISRSNDHIRRECIVCGNPIKSKQAFRALPKDKNCKEERFYHVRTCRPGSDNWKAFKANGNKSPEKYVVKGQLSFNWGGSEEKKGSCL
jgi:hypothetical protein